MLGDNGQPTTNYDPNPVRRILAATGLFGPLAALGIVRPPLESGRPEPMDEKPTTTQPQTDDTWARRWGSTPAVRRQPAMYVPRSTPTRARSATASPVRVAPGSLDEAGRPLTADEAAAEGRPATARLIRFEDQPVPTEQQPKKLAGWKNALGEIATIASGTLNPLAGQIVRRYATNAGRQQAAQQQYNQEVANRAQQERELANAADVEAGTAPKQGPYQFKQIGGHIWSVDPASGQKVADLGPTGTNARLNRVVTDDAGNAVAVFDDGTSKQLGFKEPLKQPAQHHQTPEERYLDIVTREAVDPQSVTAMDRAFAQAYARSHPHRGAGGEKPVTVRTAGEKRQSAAEAKDRIQMQIARLNQQVGSGGAPWTAAQQEQLKALQDEYNQADNSYRYWDGIYSRLSHTPPTEGAPAPQQPPVPHNPEPAPHAQRTPAAKPKGEIAAKQPAANGPGFVQRALNWAGRAGMALPRALEDRQEQNAAQQAQQHGGLQVGDTVVLKRDGKPHQIIGFNREGHYLLSPNPVGEE